jgi:alkaline phosphatase D
VKQFIWVIGCIFILLHAQSQSKGSVVAGPMPGQIETRTAKIWAAFSANTESAQIKYWKKGFPKQFSLQGFQINTINPFNVAQIEVGGLEPNTPYEYQLLVNGIPHPSQYHFTTKELWQWRKPAPDFAFITGSCSYFNEPIYDRPGKPYGGDSSIFLTMAQEKSAFMLWLGDNWYTREVDYNSAWGLWYRAHRDRSMPVLQPLLQNMSQYAIWDDHDFGPDNSSGSYGLKEVSRTVFSQFWANPFYGEDGKGTYSKFSYSDVDFFLLDDRTWRSDDNMPTTLYGQPNPDKRMLGVQQMKWLKESLMYSSATFKLIVVGSQVLNPVSLFDKLLDFPLEYNELMAFIDERKINGVVFFSGDRHHSEIIKVDRPGRYPLYDITVSPLTSGTHTFSKEEQHNPYRVIGIDKLQNYGKVQFSGPKGNRTMQISFLDVQGAELGKFEINEKGLRDN